MPPRLRRRCACDWLTDLQEEQVLVYRPDADVDTQKNPDELSGDPVLPGFTLNLGPIWDPDL